MSDYLHAILLGVIQGVAEFLPISSSGHLVIAEALLQEFTGSSMPGESATMNIAMHFGTLMAIVVVYRNELLEMRNDWKMLGLVFVATIPVGVIGLAFKDYVEGELQTPLVAGFALLITAGFLLIGRKLQRQNADERPINVPTAIAVGVFQAVAIVPGISRSGSTIAAGMACGQRREDAAKFSFLIAIPVIAGATVLKLKDFVSGEEVTDGSLLPVLVGTLVAFVVGVVALKWLIRVVVADRLHYFAAYCVVAGLLTIAWQLMTADATVPVEAAQAVASAVGSRF